MHWFKGDFEKTGGMVSFRHQEIEHHKFVKAPVTNAWHLTLTNGTQIKLLFENAPWYRRGADMAKMFAAGRENKRAFVAHPELKTTRRPSWIWFLSGLPFILVGLGLIPFAIDLNEDFLSFLFIPTGIFIAVMSAYLCWHYWPFQKR